MNELSAPDQIDIIIQEALEHDDPDIVFHQIRQLEEKKELIEAAKSKFFFTLDEVWDQFSISKTESLYTRSEANLGMHPHTVDRLITFWKFQNALPESIKERPLREKIPITKMLSQGYELEESDWENIERASTKAEVDAVIRQVKGTKPRKGSLQIYVDHEGTLYGWMDNRREDIGYLNIHGTSPILEKAIKRITDSAGVIRK